MRIRQLKSNQDPLFRQAVQVLVDAFLHDEPIRAMTGWTDAGLQASYLSMMTSSVEDGEVWIAVEGGADAPPEGAPQITTPAGGGESSRISGQTVLGVITVKPPSADNEKKTKPPSPEFEAYQALLKPEHRKYNTEAYEPLLDALHAEAYAPEGHSSMYYISLLGVVLSAQGQGIGGALVKHVIARATAAGRETAVSTHNEKNRNYYEKIGFRVLKSGLFDVYGYDKRVPFWCFKVPLPTE